jgi:signal transduction histidine kinase
VPNAAYAADDAIGAAGMALAASSVLALIGCVAAIQFRNRLLRAHREIARLRGIAESGPDQFLYKDRDEEVTSPGLAAMLGVAKPTFEALPTLFENSRTLVSALAADAAFELKLRACDGRTLCIAGNRVGTVTVLWFRNASSEVDRERTLASERDGLRSLLDMLPLPVWRRGPDLAPSFVNRAYADAVGREEIAADGRALASRARDGNAPAHETRHVVIGGERRLVEIAETPDAATGGTAGYLLDHTALEAAQAELARHIEAHDEVLHNLGTAIAIYGADRRLKFFNTSFLRVFGLEETWLRGEPEIGEVLESLRERRRLPEFADFPAHKREIQRWFTSLIEPQDELMHLPDDTTYRMTVTPHPFGGLLFTWEDVTDALALERNYNTLIEVQRETLDNLGEGVAVIGGDGRLKLSNPAFGRLWHISPETLRAGPHMDELVQLVRPFFASAAEWEAQLDEFATLTSERDARAGRLERADGSVLDWASVPLPDGAVLLVYIDVSDSTRVERALRERNEALETADRLKSEFIANVSYELRTPLNTIIGFAEILTDQYFGTLNPRQIEYSRGILESSQRLLSLINDILDLASIEAGHMTLELETIDLYRMLSSVLALTRERARKKKLDIEFDCPSDIGVIVGDERRLKQALFNILSNSIKFTPEGGSITLTARRADGQVELTFTDTGIGIPKEDHGRVFGKFERGSHPEARHGAGLGLSLVKSFIELHGGDVELESNEGKGTRLTCRLPAREPATAPAPLAHRA